MASVLDTSNIVAMSKMKSYMIVRSLDLERDDYAITNLNNFQFPYQKLQGPMKQSKAGWSMMPDENLWFDMYKTLDDIDKKLTVDLSSVVNDFFPDKQFDSYLTTVDRFRLQTTVCENSQDANYVQKYTNLHTDKTDTPYTLALIFNAGSTVENKGNAKTMKVLNIQSTLQSLQESNDKDGLYWMTQLIQHDFETPSGSYLVHEKSLSFFDKLHFDRINILPGEALLLNQKIPHYQASSVTIQNSTEQKDTLTYYYKLHFASKDLEDTYDNLKKIKETERIKMINGDVHDYQRNLANRNTGIGHLEVQLRDEVMDFYKKSKGKTQRIPTFEEFTKIMKDDSLLVSQYLATRKQIKDAVKIRKLLSCDIVLSDFMNSDPEPRIPESDTEIPDAQIEEIAQGIDEDGERAKKKMKTFEERLNDKLADIDAQIRAHENTIEVLRRQSEDIRTWWDKRPTILEVNIDE